MLGICSGRLGVPPFGGRSLAGFAIAHRLRRPLRGLPGNSRGGGRRGCSKRPAVRCWRPLLGRSRATPQTPGPHERDRPARLSRLCTSQGSAWIYMHKPAQRRPTASLGPGLRTYPRCAPALHTGGRLRPDALRLPQPAPMKVRAGTAGAPELASVPDLSVAEETERARRAWHSTWPALFAPLLHSPALRAMPGRNPGAPGFYTPYAPQVPGVKRCRDWICWVYWRRG